jgi:P2 family phage contractile tail tube protein
MAGQRTRKIMTATIEGNPLLGEVEEYTPPEIKKTMEDSRGGKFVPDEVWVGMEKMNFELKIVGASQSLLAAYGLGEGETCQIDVKTSEEDKDGNKFAIHDSLTGRIINVKEETIKMGEKPTVTITGSPTAYSKTENGTTIYDINTSTQKLNLGNGDLMEAHRRNVGIA